MALVSYFHFSFTVADLERSIAFYRDLLGLRLVHRMVHDQKYTSSQIGFADALLKVALFNIAGMPQGSSPSGHLLELIEYANPRGEPLDVATNRPGAAHLALQSTIFGPSSRGCRRRACSSARTRRCASRTGATRAA